MRLFSRLSSVAAPARMHAELSRDPSSGWVFNGSDLLMGQFGGHVPPELAMTLTYVYCAVDTISSDFGCATCQMFENTDDDGHRRVKYTAPGIGSLARQLRWQPNNWQTAKAFWSTLAWQYLLRPAAYAELIYRPGSGGFLEQIIPRHPDRVRQEVLPSGRLRFVLQEGNGKTRNVTQDEMFVIRNTSSDGLNALSRTQYGAQALASALSLQAFTSNYFKKGATASLIATYKGEKDDEDEDALHKSITRYMSGAENAGGLLLVPEDVEVTALGVDPEKAQLLGLKNLSGRDVARMFKMPPSWLGIEGAQSYGSQVQDAQNYKNRVQIPISVEFEQAVQRDLILSLDRFFVKFNLDYLTRGNLLERMQAYEIGIRSRVFRPSDARVREDMNPDEDLDRLSEGDFRPGTAGGSAPTGKPKDAEAALSARAQLKGMLALHDTAVRCLRRERAAVSKLAAKHANDVAGWQSGLKDFYSDHAGFVAQAMRVDMATARAYAAQHGSQLEAQGVVLMDDAWEKSEADELCALAMSDDRAAA